MVTQEQELVLAMMAIIIDRDDAYQAINDQLKSLTPDFPTHLKLIDDHLWRPLMGLLDGAAGDTTPSYFLEECRTMKDGGAVIETDGTRWPLKTLGDVRAYLEHVNSLQPKT